MIRVQHFRSEEGEGAGTLPLPSYGTLWDTVTDFLYGISPCGLGKFPLTEVLANDTLSGFLNTRRNELVSQDRDKMVGRKRIRQGESGSPESTFSTQERLSRGLFLNEKGGAK